MDESCRGKTERLAGNNGDSSDDLVALGASAGTALDVHGRSMLPEDGCRGGERERLCEEVDLQIDRRDLGAALSR